MGTSHGGLGDVDAHDFLNSSSAAERWSCALLMWLSTRAISTLSASTRAFSSSIDIGSRSCFASATSGSSGLLGKRSSKSTPESLTVLPAKSISPPCDERAPHDEGGHCTAYRRQGRAGHPRSAGAAARGWRSPGQGQRGRRQPPRHSPAQGLVPPPARWPRHSPPPN